MSEPGVYLGATDVEVTLDEHPFVVEVHLGLLRGRVACVGVDVRSFRTAAGEAPRQDTVSSPVGLVELTSPLLRRLRLGEVVNEALSKYRGLTQEALDYPGAFYGGEERERLLDQLQVLSAGEDGPRRPGRPTSLSVDAMVETVALTYRQHLQAGGRKPVLAVQIALQESGQLPGAGSSGDVTIHQARAAVRRARALGLLTEVDAR